MNDLNATTMDAAVKMIAGSCRAMGVTVKEDQMEGRKVRYYHERKIIKWQN